ncbi:hypothetical protein [Chryseobacterium sp. ISL-6]|uniref:hypothetical protein n=1 Tax=Chryseobacterium sp. ISL-6 TaxID=2819143 RepID=UPI001BEB6660|nr:hypothetical protein [Chryseobacterium sp. ISL-6]MBT2621302.1 hypothetical protein [Chryseobacterium sp. ISL-6]
MEKQQKIMNSEKILLWKRAEHFAEKYPQKAFYIMFGLIFFSVLFTIGNLVYVQKVSVPEYEKMKKQNILKDATTSFGATVRETEKIMDLRQALKELDYYRRKTVLSTSDSVRIKYLLDKYQIKNTR